MSTPLHDLPGYEDFVEDLVPWWDFEGQLAIVYVEGGTYAPGVGLPAVRMRVYIIDHETGDELAYVDGHTTERFYLRALAQVRRGAVLTGRIEADPNGRDGYMLDMPWIDEALVLRKVMRRLELDEGDII